MHIGLNFFFNTLAFDRRYAPIFALPWNPLNICLEIPNRAVHVCKFKCFIPIVDRKGNLLIICNGLFIRNNLSQNVQEQLINYIWNTFFYSVCEHCTTKPFHQPKENIIDILFLINILQLLLLLRFFFIFLWIFP